MPRIARTVVPGVPHHVTQRGNNRQAVFFVGDDRRAYLAMLKQCSEDHGLKIVGYCLMTNHVHLIAIPATADALAKAVGRTHYFYTQVQKRCQEELFGSEKVSGRIVCDVTGDCAHVLVNPCCGVDCTATPNDPCCTVVRPGHHHP